MVDRYPPVFPFQPLAHASLKTYPPSAVLNLLSRPPDTARVMQEGQVFSDCQILRIDLPDTRFADETDPTHI
jgi:hypothetical protein